LNFRTAFEDRESKDSEAFFEGRVIHTYVLERDKFENEYRVDDHEAIKKRAFEIHEEENNKNGKYKPPKRITATNAWKAAEEEFDDGRPSISPTLAETAKAISDNFWNNDRVKTCFKDPAQEVSIVFDLPTGMRCKARIDIISESEKRFGDLKSTRNIAWFDCDIDDYNYHRKMAFYFDGIQAAFGEPFEPWLIPAEKQKPHQVLAAPLDMSEIGTGRSEYQRIAFSISQSLATGIWPGVPQPDVWRRPKSRRKKR
jgi:hypothetical protein